MLIVVAALIVLTGLAALFGLFPTSSDYDDSQPIAPVDAADSAESNFESTPELTSPSPSEEDKAKWLSLMEDESAPVRNRQKAARDLIEHFEETSEGRRAASLIGELDKAVAYDNMGRQWEYLSIEEGMSGKSQLTARVVSSNTISLDFPYAGPQHGTLILRKHPRWGNDVIFKIERGQILCHSYGDCSVEVRFDDGSVKRYEGSPPSDNSSEYVFIPAFSTFTKLLPTAKTLKVEVSVYQSGNQVFEFDVSGFKPEKFK